MVILEEVLAKELSRSSNGLEAVFLTEQEP